MEMIKRYGYSWTFQFSEKQWNDLKNDPERRWKWEWPTELTEKVTKPCPVCGNVFLGNRYGGTTDVCPSCLSILKAAMKKMNVANGKLYIATEKGLEYLSEVKDVHFYPEDE